VPAGITAGAAFESDRHATSAWLVPLPSAKGGGRQRWQRAGCQRGIQAVVEAASYFPRPGVGHQDENLLVAANRLIVR
jgi:hypothetical protein